MSHHLQRRWFGFGPLFENPWTTSKTPTIIDGIKVIFTWAFRRGFNINGTLLNNKNPRSADFKNVFPLSVVDWLKWNNQEDGDEVKCIWIGHATCLVKIHDLTFLTDPVFSNRCSPYQFLGPKRVVEPAFEISDPNFTHLDFVIISHSHYDHLDYLSVLRLHQKFGSKLIWYVPLNLKKWFVNIGMNNVVEMDWWQTVAHKSAKITFLPAQHWSNRQGFVDINRSLWGSWLVENGDPIRKVWFAGDTGYCPVFKEIAAYNPRFFMKFQHVNPEEAVRIHQDVNSKCSIAIHCCTFCLTLEPMDEPPLVLQRCLEKHEIKKEEFLCLCHGEIIRLKFGQLVQIPKTLSITQ